MSAAAQDGGGQAAAALTPQPPRAPSGLACSGDALNDALQAERDELRALFPLPAPRAPGRRTVRSRTRNAGLALAVMATAAAVLVGLDPAWHTEQHATAIGEQRTVALADGTRLTLDTATGVRVRWHLRSRRLELLQGRARFDVAPSSLRPLYVAAGSVQVRVVGTVFDVQREGYAPGPVRDPTRPQVRVTVLEGRVQVRDAAHAGAAWVLGPGQRLLAGGAQPAAPEAFDTSPSQGDAAGGWAQGRLVFDRVPLRDALAEVQRYRSAPIRLHGDGRLAQQAVSGVFETTRTDQLLDLLPHALGARVQRRADGSVDVSR